MKRLLLALIILLSPVMALLPIATSDDTASAWVSGYTYRKSFLVNGSSDGVMTNYQLKLTVNNSSGISSGSTVYLNGSSLVWPNDFRFTNASDGNLDFWIESNTSTEATVWVELDSIVNGSTNQSSFYIYYANAGASTASNGTNTFLFFDHFDTDLSKWTGDTANASVASSIMTLTRGGTDAIIYSTVHSTGNIRFRTLANIANINYDGLGLSESPRADDYVNVYRHSGYANNTNWAHDNGAGPTGYSTQAVGFGANHIFDFCRLVSGTDTVRYFYDNVQVGAGSTLTVTTADLYASFYTYTGVGGTVSSDWAFLSNYTYNEPIYSTWGATETDCTVYLTTSSGAGGNVSTPAEGTTPETCNASVAIVAVADACYHFVNWTGNTTAITNTSAASTTIAMGTTNKTATANFAINTSTITYTASAGGTINGTSPQTGNCGSNTTSVTAVANACYYFVNWSGGGTSATRNDTWTSTNQTFTANFASYTYGSPTSLSSYADEDSVNLAWAKGVNTSETVIRWKIGAYSTSIADGNIIANQSGHSYTHTGLLSGTSYYYTLWGKNGVCLSSSYSQIMCTTTASSGAAATPNPLPTQDTSGWFGETNASALENNPLYPAINQMADGIGMPHKTWWILLTLGFMTIAGIWIFIKTDNLLLAISVSITIAVIAAIKIFLIPLWIAIVMGLITAGLAWKEIR